MKTNEVLEEGNNKYDDNVIRKKVDLGKMTGLKAGMRQRTKYILKDNISTIPCNFSFLVDQYKMRAVEENKLLKDGSVFPRLYLARQ